MNDTLLAPPFYRPSEFRELKPEPRRRPAHNLPPLEQPVKGGGCPPELLKEWLLVNQPTVVPAVILPAPLERPEPGIKPPRRGVPFKESSNMEAIRAILAVYPGLTSKQILEKLRVLDHSRFALTKATNIHSWLAEARSRPKPRIRSEKSPEGVLWFLTRDGLTQD